MVEDMVGVDGSASGDYMHDLRLLKAYGSDNFVVKYKLSTSVLKISLIIY